MLPIGYKSEKLQWRHNLLNCQFFWRFFVSLNKFSYWSKWNVNIITDSGVMTIFFHKGLTRNLKIEKKKAEFCLISSDWGKLEIPNLPWMSMIMLIMLLNVGEFQVYSHYRFWVIKEKPTTWQIKLTTPPTRLGIIVFISIQYQLFWFNVVLIQ